MEKIKENFLNQESIKIRPPIVVVLGHVDHGKTKLLDTIRKTNIVDGEAGGITQHIGAYQIDIQEEIPPNLPLQKGGGEKGGQRVITFIDTPGHEAFHQMRLRGAKVADIAVLVIAAEEGVKPQTKEAIEHIKEARIPFIVALNKMDKPDADPNRVKQELAQEEIFVEGWGGDVPVVEISALKDEGINNLLELILLVADLEELKADYSGAAEGIIIESFLDKNRGPSATLLVLSGVLKKDDYIWSGNTFGKARILEDFLGNEIKKVYPSQPALIVGLKEAPMTGEKFLKVDNEESARRLAIKSKVAMPDVPRLASLPDMENRTLLFLIIKSDVKGSLEAIKEVLNVLPQEKIKMNIIKAEVGEVNENDVTLAKTTGSVILAFKVGHPFLLDSLLAQTGVELKEFNIIYELAEFIRKYLEFLESKEKPVEIEIGRLKVLAIFRTEKNRMIIGGKVLSGVAKKGTRVEVLRSLDENQDLAKVGEGKVLDVKKLKESVAELNAPNEGGVLFEGGFKIKEGDILVFYGIKK